MKFTPIIGAAAALISLVPGASMAAAASGRTFVSGHGADSGGCTVTAPCRSFAYAITQTSAGGDIVVLDTAGYGAVTINEAISIVSPTGIQGFISVASGNGITITANAGDRVTLRGLTIEGSSSNLGNGIEFDSGGRLEVSDCVVDGFDGAGIEVLPSASMSYTISDSYISNNGNNVDISVSGGTVTGQIRNVTMDNAGGNGLSILQQQNGVVFSTIINSEIADNGGSGVYINSFGAENYIDIRDTNVSANGTGVNASGSTTVVRLSRSTIAADTTPLSIQQNAVVTSFGDNTIETGGSTPPVISYK